MKTLLFALVMMFAVSLNGQNNVNNLTQWNIDTFTNQILRELNIDSCFVVIQPTRGLIYDKYDAITKTFGGCYTVLMSNYMNYDQTLITLAHELVHVKQMKSGILKILSNGEVEFKGLKYKTNESTHYTDPQEVEARNLGMVLYEKFKPIRLN